MAQQEASIVVLGAGLLGSCIALELAQNGLEVALLDQDEAPMNRASLRNEGKIHLGLVYANDRSLATANLQIRGALSFRSLLGRWIGPAADRLRTSTPFYYLVAKDSLLDPAELTEHYAAVEDVYFKQLARDPDCDYLGTRPEHLYRRLAPEEFEPYLRAEQFEAGFETAELAIDSDQLANLVRKAIAASPGISFLPSRKVEAVSRTNGLMRVEGVGLKGPWRMDTKQVVNATWESRRAIDRSLGLEFAEGWVYRLKYRVLAHIPEDLQGAPSATMVLGPYGDVVIRPDRVAYLSWYPLGLRGWSHALSPPASWDAVCRGEVGDDAQELAARTLQAIDAWFPGIGRSKPFQVDAGVIVAYGRTDIDDNSSGLHDRANVGVTSTKGYHSVDSGKLTTAPLLAMAAAERVIAESKMGARQGGGAFHI